MNHRRRALVLVAALMLVAPSLASAQNFYAGVRGGLNITSNNKQGAPGGEDVFEYSPGFIGGMALGYRLPFSLRAEGEGSFLWSPVKTDGGVNIDGSVKTWLMMANIYYDLKLAFLGPFRPYVGFGIGGARVNNDHEVFVDSLGVKVDVDDSRTAFAYQARIGVTWDFNQWLDLSAGYRFVHINGGSPNLQGRTINFEGMNNHSLEVGFAVKF